MDADIFPMWLVAIPIGLGAFYLGHKYWPRTPTQLFDLRARELDDDMRSRGLTAEQRQEEMSFRYAMARLRQHASKAVLARPADHQAIISDLVAKEAKMLALTNRAVSRRFVAVVKAAPLRDILYKDALKAVDALPMVMVRSVPTSIDIAAVTTIKD